MFGINNSEDKLNLLIQQCNELRQDPLNTGLALMACQNAWHIADWVYKKQKLEDSQLTKEKFRTSLHSECPEMKILHDMVNLDKHKEINRPKVHIKKTKSIQGDFSPDFSKDFHVSRLEVHYGESKKIDIDDLLEVAIKYWGEILKSRVVKEYNITFRIENSGQRTASKIHQSGFTEEGDIEAEFINNYEKNLPEITGRIRVISINEIKIE